MDDEKRFLTTYRLLQQELQASFPEDDEADYWETMDVDEEILARRRVLRRDLKDTVEQFKLLAVDALREQDSAQDQQAWRQKFLYRLAALYEMDAIAEVGTVDGLAQKVGVSFEQGAASAVLKIQAEELHKNRAEIEAYLLELDQGWQNTHLDFSPEVQALLDIPAPTQYYERYRNDYDE